MIRSPREAIADWWLLPRSVSAAGIPLTLGSRAPPSANANFTDAELAEWDESCAAYTVTVVTPYAGFQVADVAIWSSKTPLSPDATQARRRHPRRYRAGSAFVRSFVFGSHPPDRWATRRQ